MPETTMEEALEAARFLFLKPEDIGFGSTVWRLADALEKMAGERPERSESRSALLKAARHLRDAVEAPE
jgi:hypothetical protein